MIKVSQEKLSELFIAARLMSEALVDNDHRNLVVELPDEASMESDETPDWYEYVSYDEAKITFEDRGNDTVVMLKDCTSKDSLDLGKLAKNGKEDSIDGSAKLLMAHIESVSGDDRAKVFKADLPPSNAKLSAWSTLAGNMGEKNLLRIIEGIHLFRRDVGEEGND